MIHMPIARDELDARIKAAVPTWFARAAKGSADDAVARRQASKSEIWGEIKAILRAHQRNKCAYCEIKLGTEGIDWHVEHFRPKRRVDAWNVHAKGIGRTGGANATGYYLLAFDPSNYLASCAACNSTYKQNYFPVLGRRRLTTTDPVQLARERPGLLNPLDASDDPPETLISFYGITPVIVATDRRARRRARITIELLSLHDREKLDYPRAQVISGLWRALEDAQRPDPAREAEARRLVAVMTRDGSPFSNCARSFKLLYERNAAEARTLMMEALDYLDTHS
jgi:uncharacterized protein (TIGR02646 family)